MGRRVIFLFTVFFLLVFTGLSGCGEEETKESAGGRIYFLNDAETQLVAEGYEMKATFRDAQVQEFVDALAKEPEGRKLKKLLPDNVSLINFTFGEAEQLILNFDANYSSLSGITEILVRAAGLYAALPEGTTLSKISTREGVCYLDLGGKFLDKPEGVNEAVVLYSIVNSLVELPNVNKVQIRVNGELQKSYQSFEMPEVFERNLDLIETEM